MKVLIAEDDDFTREGLVEILEGEGYEVCEAPNGAVALELYEEQTPDFVCLDVMMPQINGYDVCKKIRENNHTIPVIFISAKSEEIDKVVGLELGADDFIVKPFGMREVVARIRAVTRRCLALNLDKSHESATEGDDNSPAEKGAPFDIGDLHIVPMELRAFRKDEPIDLNIRDIRILDYLARHPNCPIERTTLFRECWDLRAIPHSRTLDQHISQLRKRIEQDPKNPTIIETVHGVGYRYPSENKAPSSLR